MEIYMFLFSVFSMLDLFVFLVPFTAGGNVKNIAVCVQNQGLHKMKNVFKVRFRMIFGSVSMSCS
jgi:hypothetical protein